MWWCWGLLIRPLQWWPHAHTPQQQHVIDSSSPNHQVSPSSISAPLFADLERLSRLVDVSYCVGNTGLHKPFRCLSRCKEFPDLSLAMTWSTGFLMGDSCGYIAVDHGNRGLGNQDGGVSGERNGASIIVAFRGTYSITNTVVDLGTIPQEYMPYPAPDDDDSSFQDKHRGKCDNCTVHMGFLHSWRMARQTVVPELKALRRKYPSYQIQLVGHSLGGAVACLAALELKLSLGWDNLAVTTFGEPRVGNYQLARYIDKAFQLDGTTNLEQRTYRRVTHSNDPVPLLPLKEWGYKPHGGEIYISKQELRPTKEDIRTCVGDSDPGCSAGAETSLLEDMRRLLHFASASPSMEEYIAARTLPTRLKIWQLFFAHRDYFWRLGLCVPGGDPANWGRGWSGGIESEEL